MLKFDIFNFDILNDTKLVIFNPKRYALKKGLIPFYSLTSQIPKQKTAKDILRNINIRDISNTYIRPDFPFFIPYTKSLIFNPKRYDEQIPDIFTSNSSCPLGSLSSKQHLQNHQILISTHFPCKLLSLALLN